MASIGSLTRVLVESYRPFYYLTIENIKDEEREFRYLLFEVYLLIERRSMIEAIRNDNNYPDRQTDLVENKKKIRNHTYYKFLSTKNSEHIYGTLVQSIENTGKNGNKEFSQSFMDRLAKCKGCFKNDQTILLERLATYVSDPFSDQEKKIGNRFDKFFNKLMSNYVHSGAFAISMERDSNFQLNQEVENYLNQMVSCCIFYLITATHDLLKLCQLSQNNDLIQECEKAKDGAFVFLAILRGRCTSAETNP